MSFYRNQLEDYLKGLEIKADRVLDIGGGALPVKDRVKSWDVKDYVVLDNGLEGAKCKIDIEGDLNDIDSSDVFKGETFDLVFCLEVFEYIYKPLEALKAIYGALKKGGKAYITFPFVYPQHEPVMDDCLRYTKAGVHKLLAHAGFMNWGFISRVDRSGKLVEFYRADGMHPAKGIEHNVTGFIVEVNK